MNKKVLIITYYWPPSGGAGVQRWLKFAKYLPEFGWDPVVLTVDEKFASYAQLDFSLLKDAENVEVHKTKSFEVYNLYTKFGKNKQIPFGGFSNDDNPGFTKKLSRFIRGNFFIPDPRRGWKKFAIKKAIELIENLQIDTVVTTSPPHSTQLIGLKLKRKRKHINWVADFRDPWTDIYYYKKFYPTRLAKAIDRKLEQKVITNADKLITVSHSMKKLLGRRYNSEDKFVVIPNGYDSEDFTDELFENTNKTNEILYTGTVTDDYPIQEVITIAKNNPDLKFRFVGNVPKNFADKVKNEGLENSFRFDNPVPHNQIIKEMVNAEILLLLIPKIQQNEGILTGKLFEYIGSRTPILAIGPKDGDAEKVILSTKCGSYFAYEEVAEITREYLLKLTSVHAHINGEQYTRKNLAGAVSDFLNQ